MNKNRYHLLDSLRGATLISMIAYHTVWDMVYMFGADMPWYRTRGAFYWQQSICMTFILLSGFCFSLGKHKYKRAIQVLAASVLITVVTVVAMPSNAVWFGVLSAIGTGMLVMAFTEKWLSKINPYAGILICLNFFVFTRDINMGRLGFGDLEVMALPKSWYRNLFTAYLGFPAENFASTDYFSVFPWLFLYQTGYFLYQIAERKNWLKYLKGVSIKPLEMLGRNSLWIYLLHQPLVYGILCSLY